MNKLDKLDKKILRELQKNARITITELAKKIGISVTPCRIRMRRLEDQGAILGYTALIDRRKLGEKYIAFVQVTLNNTSTRALKKFTCAVLNTPEIEQCQMIAANYDYLIKIRTTDITSCRIILGERISALPYVAHISTFVVMEEVKTIIY